MREINFFEHLQPSKNISKDKFIVFISVFFVCQLFIVYAIFNTIRIISIEKEVAVLSQASSSVEAMQKLATIRQIREETIDLESTYNIFKKNYEAIIEESSIDYMLFNSIVSASPIDLFFKSLRIEEKTVSIDVFTHSQNSLTEFEKNIANKDNLKVDAISNLVMKPGHYSFTIVISIEE